MRQFAIAAAAALFAGEAAQASTLSGDYSLLPSYSEAAGMNVNLWFEVPLTPETGRNFEMLAPGSATFDGAGNGTLEGTAYSSTSLADGFAFEMSFDQNYALAPEFKDVFDRWPDPGNIAFYNLASGTLTGLGGFAGVTMQISAFPDPGGAATQIGGGTGTGGANQHNGNYGGSLWFAIDSVDGANACALCINNSVFDNLVGAQGDLVFDLEPAPVPLPAGGVLALTALAGLAALRRR